ncbi:MAG: enoyl-CoA hydratase-related protein [SAR202 cluster bacterium]|jgi:enoyl-CoA hydratase/carnithine racemase|nr:enoyl-CoA hydratase-related protein [SAR202 cluster bacterium]MDP7103593.1 enoyl-CoA hydratase-related protein [SAR202 cluster bacterium]|tara:strand:+ start:397 stop:1194 length:798 start_codon:yes stop_codon:yes gene_type:complete
MASLDGIVWERVLWELSDSGVLAITLDRAERLNAVSFRTLNEVQWLVDHAGSNPDVRVVTIRGAGNRAFCSGDDMKGMEPEPGVDDFHVHRRLIRSLRALPKPVVALVNGWALGFGFELASACDFRLCADDIEVGDHRVTRSIGMIGGSSWFLPRIIGQGRALEMLMTGSHLRAQQALDWGWANRVWPVAEFHDRAAEYVEMLAGMATVAVGGYKEAMEYSMTHSLRDSLSHEYEVSTLRVKGTDDQAEGRASWLERRNPKFTGR